jgi:golgi phosphoprotein 3
MLTLYEELYLLALDEDKGNIYPFVRKSLPYVLSGAILAELRLLGKVEASGKLRLIALDATPTGDPFLDGVLEQISSSEKARKLTYWVSLLSEEPKKLRLSVGERLVEKNVLIQDEKRFYRRPVVAEGEFSAPEKFQIKNLLRAIILSNGESDFRSLALLTIILSGDLLSLIFTEDEIENAKRMIHKKVLAAAMENPLMQFIEEIDQAVSSVREDEMD